MAPESSFPGSLRTEGQDAFDIPACMRNIPPNSGVKIFVYDLTDAECAEIRSVGVVVDPRHLERWFVSCRKVSLREVMVAKFIVSRE